MAIPSPSDISKVTGELDSRAKALTSSQSLFSRLQSLIPQIPIISQLAKVAGISPDQALNTIVTGAEDSVSAVAKLMGKVMTDLNYGSDLYLYYIAMGNLQGWLSQRIAILNIIQQSLMSLLEMQVSFYTGIPVARDMEIFLNFLEYAAINLTRITNTVPLTYSPQSSSTEVKNTVYAKTVFWASQSIAEIQNAIDYLSLLDYRNMTLSAKAKSILNTMNIQLTNAIQALNVIANNVPVLTGILITDLATLPSAGSGITVNNISLNSLSKVLSPLQSTSTLTSLNSRIAAAKNSISLYQQTLPNFLNNVTQNSYSNNPIIRDAMLDTFIQNARTVDYPTNEIDFLAKSIIWQTTLTSIKVDIAGNAGFGALQQPLLPQLSNTFLANYGAAGIATSIDYSLQLQNELTKRYTSLATMITASSVSQVNSLRIQIKYLLNLTLSAINQDQETITLLNTLPPPPGYTAFSTALSQSLNIFQKADVFGSHTSDIISFIRDGSLLNILSTGKTTLATINNAISSIENFSLNNILDLAKEPLLQSVNLFGSTVVPVATKTVTDSFKGASEILTSVNNYLKGLKI